MVCAGEGNILKRKTGYRQVEENGSWAVYKMQQVILMQEVPEAFPMSSQTGGHSTKAVMVDKVTR